MNEFEPVEPELTLETEQQVTSGGSSGIGGRVAAGVVGVLLLVGGSVFAVTQLGSSGPASPEDAVQAMLDAAADEDVLGLLAALDPAERDALREPVEDLFDELARLEVVDDSFELNGVDGLDLEFADVTYRTEPVRDGLTRVYITGGTVTGAYDLDELPIGDFVADTLERFDVEYEGRADSETEDLVVGDEVFLAAREGDDGWRVSIGYTAAEAARLDAGLPLPAGGITPIGAESPEGAVEGMMRAVADLELEAMVARLSPDEFGALQDYAELFLPDAERELDAFRQEFQISIEDLQLRAETDGDDGTVFVDGFTASATADGETITMSVDGECFEISGDIPAEEFEGTPFGDGPVCADELTEFSESMFDAETFGTDPEFEDPFAAFEGFPPFNEVPEVGIAVHRIDGEWYVAPLESVLDAMVTGLRAIDRSHLDAMVDLVEGFIDSFTLGFEEGFTVEDGVPLDGQEFEDFEEIPGSEIPAPTTTFVPGQETPIDDREPPGPVDEAALEELVRIETAGDDPAVADCMLAELAGAPPYARWELADAYVNDYQPSFETLDHLFAAFEACY